MDKKASIIQYIERAKSLVFDSNTFLKVRTDRHDHHIYIGEGLGGGNLLIALGLFSALSYLAKIYVLLNSYWTLPSSADVEEAKNVFDKIDTKFKDYLILIKRIDFINETDAFARLLSDSNCPQNLGISTDEYQKVYHDIRDHLVHRVAPNRGHTMVTFQTNEDQKITYSEIKKAIMEGDKPVFEKKDERLICYVDILSRDVERISDWLISKVKNNEFSEDNINKTYDWLECKL